MKVIISDTSSLILAEKIALLNYVVKKWRVYVPEEVYREAIIRGKERNAKDAYTLENKIQSKKISVIKIKDAEKVQKLMNEFGIAKGETEAIVLFLEQKAEYVLLDDHKAINACKVYNVPFVTTLVLVVSLMKQKLINKEKAEEMIKNLAVYGRYKSELILRALEEVKNG